MSFSPSTREHTDYKQIYKHNLDSVCSLAATSESLEICIFQLSTYIRELLS